jgi:hypothetical protein
VQAQGSASFMPQWKLPLQRGQRSLASCGVGSLIR